MEKVFRIVFMGTPDFAVASLDTLCQAGWDIAGVITAPDKPAGRGRKLQMSPVKSYALEKALPVLQPENLKSPDFLEALRQWKADLQVVVAFRMLPRQVWSMPPLGTINLHASLLPQYRGAAPINHAIINGEKETGLTTFFLNDTIDTGDIILTETISIGASETSGELHDRMKVAGANLLQRTVMAIYGGNARGISQELKPGEDVILKNAPKIHREDCRIDWTRDVVDIYNLIRGLSPVPGAFSLLRDEMEQQLVVKIFRAEYQNDSHCFEPGKIHSDGRTFLRIYASNGWIGIKDLQMEGKKRMNIEDFLRGVRNIESGRMF